MSTTTRKQQIRDLLKSIETGDSAAVAVVNPDKYTQHNPQIADGLSGLGAALEEFAKQGIVMKYDRIHRVLGEGDFVLVVSEGSLAGNHSSFYDLFRVADGKLAEHWDTIETIAPRDQWRNENGKF